MGFFLFTKTKNLRNNEGFNFILAPDVGLGPTT